MNIKPVKKKHVKVAWSLLIVCFLIGIFYTINTLKSMTYALEVENERLLERSQTKVLHTLEVAQTTFKEPVLFTNYGTWDNESKDITASGHSSKDFEINELGMYTYEGKIVLATANTSRWNRSLKSGYNSHELYDLIDFELNGNMFAGIVLDVCGACQGLDNEEIQRYDIYTTSNVVGLTEGLVFWGEE